MNRLDLTPLQDYFATVLREYIDRNNTTQKEIAALVGIQESNLSNLLKKNEDGKYQRPLTASYLFRFRGLLNMAEFQKAWKTVAPRLANSPDGHRIDQFWDEVKMCSDTKLISKLRQAQELGLDLHSFLDGYIQSRQNQHD